MRKRSLLVVVSLVGGSIVSGVGAGPAEAAYPGQNGRILFAGDGGFGTWDIHTMNPDGTDVVNLTPGAFNAEYATWSPDGTKIAFSSVEGSPSGCARGDIYVMNADGSDVTPLTTNEIGVAAYDPTWSPDGSEIAFTRAHQDSTCNTGDVDIWKMNSDGSGQVLLTAGGNAFGPADDEEPAWSPDGDRIAFRSDRTNADWATNDQIWTMDPDGSNVTQVTHQDFHTFERNIAPAWSPDGEQIAFQHFPFRPPPGLGSSQISLINEDGSGETAVTSNGIFNMNPAWSPDGQRIIFTTHFEDPPGEFNNDIFAINPDGSDQINVTNTGTAKDRSDWGPAPEPDPSPIGKIAFLSAGPEGSFTEDIWTMNSDGSDKVNLLPGDFSDQSPAWSPDGTRIAFSRGAMFPSGCMQGDIFVMNADGSNVTQLTHNPIGQLFEDPTWSPNGEEIAFTRRSQDSSCQTGVTSIWKMNSDGTGQIAVTEGGGGPINVDEEPSWSPDGDRIAFVSDRPRENGDSYFEIWTVAPDGTNRTKLTDTPVFIEPEDNVSPAYSPDGDKIAWVHWFMISGNPEIWVMNEDGSNEHAVVSNGFTSNTHPTWSPDGQQLAFSGQDGCCIGFDSEIFTINIDGTGQTQITDNTITDWYPDWGPAAAAPVDPDVVVTDCDDPELAALTTVSGNLIIQDVAGCEAINLPNLTEVGGDLIITGNADAAVINLPNLTSVGGNLELSNNHSAGELDLGSLVNVSGNLEISNNHSAGELALGSLVTVSGNLEISGNTAAERIDVAALVETGGNLLLSDNTSAGDLSLPSLETVGGAFGMSGNTATGGVNLAALTDVVGNLDITGNGAAEVNVSLSSVAGDVVIESTGDGTFDPGPASAGGDTTLSTDGYDAVSASTASGDTTVENARADAVMRVHLPEGAFETPVAFTLTRLDPDALTPEEGTDAAGDPATVDPLTAYEFAFDIPTLDLDATLSFDVVLSGLDQDAQDLLLAALQAGTTTLVTKGDAPDDDYQAFALCAPAQDPAADGCVLVEALDENGDPTTGTPSVVRFTGVTGHFSTWGVAIVETLDEGTTPPVIDPHADVTAEATEPGGALVTYALPGATDDADGTVPVDCSPAPGTLFPVGSTTVQCTAEDAAGNQAVPTNFEVTVVGALDQLATLKRDVDGAAIHSGLRHDLSNKLKEALKELDKKNGPHLDRACHKLDEFIKKVDRESSKKESKLGTATAVEWIGRAERIESALGC